MKARKEVEAYINTALMGFGQLNLKTAHDDKLNALREALMGVLEEIDDEISRRWDLCVLKDGTA